MKKEAPRKTPRPGFVRRFVSVLGPGLVSGAADDDPSGIATDTFVSAAKSPKLFTLCGAASVTSIAIRQVSAPQASTSWTVCASCVEMSRASA